MIIIIFPLDLREVGLILILTHDTHLLRANDHDNDLELPYLPPVQLIYFSCFQLNIRVHDVLYHLSGLAHFFWCYFAKVHPAL